MIEFYGTNTHIVILCECFSSSFSTHMLSVLLPIFLCFDTAISALFTEYLIAAETHNASQLKSWGEHYIIVHYDKILQQNRSALTMLPVNVAETLEARRWPPVWYLMENEWYKKTMEQQEAMKRHKEKRKWYRKPH